MAILSDGQALALIKAPKYSKELAEAKEKRIRHSLHTETRTSLRDYTRAAWDFFTWCAQMLKGPGAYERFVNIARPPFPTNKLVEGIFTAFNQIFEATNSFEQFDFTSPELEQDFTEYRKKLGDYGFWKTQGMEALKSSIDDMVVIDLPQLKQDDQGNYIQDSDRPEPYYYILDIDRIHDVRNDKVITTDGLSGKEFYYFKCEYLIFTGTAPEGYKRYFVLDDVAYRIFDQADGQEARLISVAPHLLGYTPARSFWTTPLHYRATIQKSGPITDSLSDLDWLNFFSYAQRYTETYAAFPIYAIYKKKCNYKEDVKNSGMQHPRQCMGGYLEYPGVRSLPENRVPCPSCGGEAQIGAGSIILIDPPVDEDQNLMQDPVKVISADTPSLEYIQKRLTEIKSEITINSIGRSKDTNDAAAKNELQVESGFQSSNAILLKYKRNFEVIHSFALDTVCRLRYGEEYLGSVIDYGDEFFTKTEEDENKSYTEAKAAKLPAFDLAERRRDMSKARYRNNPKMLRRLEIMENLEPYPDMSIQELTDFKKESPDLVDDREYIIKARFIDFINRFEREQGDINNYGSAIDFSKKISLINEELTAYAQELLDRLAKQKEASKPDPAVLPPGTPPADPNNPPGNLPPGVKPPVLEPAAA